MTHVAQSAGGGGSGSGGGGRGRRLFATTGGGGGGGGEPTGPWGKYLQLLESNPFLTRAVTCGVLNGLGEHRTPLHVLPVTVVESTASELKVRQTRFS